MRRARSVDEPRPGGIRRRGLAGAAARQRPVFRWPAAPPRAWACLLTDGRRGATAGDKCGKTAKPEARVSHPESTSTPPFTDGLCVFADLAMPSTPSPSRGEAGPTRERWSLPEPPPPVFHLLTPPRSCQATAAAGPDQRSQPVTSITHCTSLGVAKAGKRPCSDHRLLANRSSAPAEQRRWQTPISMPPPRHQ